MSNHALEPYTGALPPAIRNRELVLSPVMDLQAAKSRMEEFQQFVQYYLEESKDGGQDGGDFGAIPGAGKKKVLLKSGADKLCELYGLYDEYEIEAHEDFATKLFYYKIKCVLKSRRDDSAVGTGVGSCSTYESKYRWRDSQRLCPKCQAQAIIKGKEEYGGGWLCWDKKGGCKSKFKDGDQSIEGQPIGRVENPDIMDTVNTVLKMAKKRAKVDAVIGVTRSSGIFTQDLDDVPMPPAKPPVPVTDTEIPIPPPKSAANNKVQGGEPSKGIASTPPPQAAETATLASAVVAAANRMMPEPSLPPVPNDGITKPQAVNLHRAFREALDPSKQKLADELLKDWLRVQKIVNVLGEPSTLAIKSAAFEDVKLAAVEYAKTFSV